MGEGSARVMRGREAAGEGGGGEASPLAAHWQAAHMRPLPKVISRTRVTYTGEPTRTRPIPKWH
eukprot:7001909-Prymnesium_polylepis.1